MKRFWLISIGVLLAIVLLPIAVPLQVPWTAINCRTQEINIKTGQARHSRYLWFVKVTESVQETPVSLVLRGKQVEAAEIETWQRVNTLDLWHRHSPHYLYHCAYAQIHTLRIAFNMGGYSLEEQEELAVELLMRWQTAGSDGDAFEFVEAAVREALERYDQAHPALNPASRVP